MIQIRKDSIQSDPAIHPSSLLDPPWSTQNLIFAGRHIHNPILSGEAQGEHGVYSWISNTPYVQLQCGVMAQANMCTANIFNWTGWGKLCTKNQMQSKDGYMMQQSCCWTWMRTANFMTLCCKCPGLTQSESENPVTLQSMEFCDGCPTPFRVT